jgi:Zn-dependent protease
MSGHRRPRHRRGHEIARVAGVPVLWRWEFPTLALLPMLAVDFEVLPSLGFVMGSALLVAVHELGHLVAARATGHRVEAIEVSTGGGVCWLAYPPRSRRADLVISAGGVLAQLVLFALTLLGWRLLGAHRSPWSASLLVAFTVMNVVMLIQDLIPSLDRSSGLASDGHHLHRLLRRRRRSPA